MGRSRAATRIDGIFGRFWSGAPRIAGQFPPAIPCRVSSVERVFFPYFYPLFAAPNSRPAGRRGKYLLRFSLDIGFFRQSDQRLAERFNGVDHQRRRFRLPEVFHAGGAGFVDIFVQRLGDTPP